MHKDIIRNILTLNIEKKNIKEKVIKEKNKAFHQIFEIDKQTKKALDQKKLNENNKFEDENIKNNISLKNKDFVNKDELFNEKIINVMKTLNFISIMKSFFCFKDKKIKLINLFNDIINKDFCIERILKWLYSLENDYNLLIEGNNRKSYQNKEISNIKKLINRINNELIKETKDKEEISIKEDKINS